MRGKHDDDARKKRPPGVSGRTPGKPPGTKRSSALKGKKAGARRWNFAEQPAISGAATWEWDVAAGTVVFSPEWEHILQSREFELMEPHDQGWWRERVHEQDLENVLALSREIMLGHINSFDLTFRLRRIDNCWAWLNSRASISAWDGDKPAFISGLVIDISPLRTDPAFQMGGTGIGDSSYHAMLENSPDMYVRMDRELFPVYINPVVARYMDRDRNEYTFTDTLEDLKMDPRQLEFLQKNVGRVFDEAVAVREMVSFATAFGNEVTGEYSFWPEFDADGKVMFAMTHFRDLTEQYRAEQRARLNEQRLDALYQLTQMDNAAEDKVLEFVMDSLLKLTSSSNGFIFFPHDEPMGKGHMLWSNNHYETLGRYILTDDVFPGDLVSLTTEEDGGINFRSMRNGNGLAPVHVSFEGRMPIFRSLIAPGLEGDRIVCIAGVCNKGSDYEEADLQQLETFINGAWLVLRRQRFMRELQRAKDAAEHANRVKDEFLANVSHELRTPLNGMLSMLQLLDLLPMSEQQRDYLRAASLSGKALLRIISDILDFSRMESGKMELHSELFDMKAAIRSAMSLFMREAEKKGLKCSLKIDEAIPERLLGDDARVRQIIFNLVGNALKFTEKGTIAVECRPLPEHEDGRARVYIAVQDSGIGIPKDQQTAIFDAFTQVDSSSTRKYSGTGLGLGIVKRLVGMMDGDISVESEVGEGTTIHCSLTFAQPLPVAAGAKASRLQGGARGSARLDILVAEDDDVGRFAIRAMLQRAGHRPLCVSNGRQALEALKLHRFHCLFTDIQMPDMDGLEVVERIRRGRLHDIEPSAKVRGLVAEYAPGDGGRILEVDPDLMIVAVSAHAMSGDKERFLRQGVNFYISKPIIMDRLTEILARIVRAREAATVAKRSA